MMKQLLVCPLAIYFSVTGLFAQGGKMNLTEELRNFSDISRLPVLRPGTVEEQVSTYDRTGGNDDGFNGTFSFIRKNPDGSLMIFDQDGPGVINRIATPTPTKDTLDFYVDDLVHPALSICYNDLFSGKVFPFVLPLCGHAVGGNYCYFPILFQTHCRIICRGKKMQFHQIGYRLYRKNTLVKSFSAFLDADERGALEQVASAWNQSLIPPMSKSLTSSSGKVLLRAGGRIVGIELEPEYTLDNSSVIRIKFDGQLTVNCPITTFFGYAFGKPAMQSLLLGTKENLAYCYFPMPYDREAAVELTGFQGTLKVYYTEEKRKPDEGRFYAKYTSDTLSPMEPYHVFLDTKGSGHYVGTILLAQGIHQDGTPFFEGDDSTATDGVFRMHGTGSEDYFNGGWYDIKGRWDTVMNLPLHGCLGYSHKLSRTGGYRLYLTDKMPFENSLFECIEHGRTASGVPAYYASIALYYKK